MKHKNDIYTCHGCGFKDERVEAGGIYYCPNPFCTISGAWPAREKLGFQQVPKIGSDSTELSPLGIYLMNWMMKMVEMHGGKLPVHFKKLKDESVLFKVPEKNAV